MSADKAAIKKLAEQVRELSRSAQRVEMDAMDTSTKLHAPPELVMVVAHLRGAVDIIGHAKRTMDELEK